MKKIAPYLEAQFARIGQPTVDHLRSLYPQNSWGIWSYFLAAGIILAIVFADMHEPLLAWISIGAGIVLTIATINSGFLVKDPFDEHLARISAIPFEVHGYLDALADYDDHKAEYFASGDKLEAHITITFTKPVAKQALAEAKALRDLPNGAEVRVTAPATILYIQHKLMIIGERWDDPRFGNNPLKTFAGQVSYLRHDWQWYRGGPLAEFRKKQPLQKWFMQLVATRLEPLHGEYGVREVRVDLQNEM